MVRLGVLLVLALGCDLFPAELYRQDAAPPDGGDTPVLRTVDECVDPPALEQEVVNALVDLDAHRDDDAGGACGLSTPGNDAYFAIPMEAGEKWHVHVAVRASLGFDPAIAITEGCGGACAAASDRCRADQDEHLSFVAPAAGTYVVRLDGKLAGGGVYEVLVAQPVCGDGGGAEHSESCDDGNTVSGDGCDDRCRAELSAGAGEVEPNDDPSEANVLRGPVAVSGRVGGRCDLDHFVVVHGGGPLVASLGARSGPCAAPSVTLELVDGAGRVLATGTPEGDACARLEHVAEAGELFLRLEADPLAPDFEYALAIE